MSRPIHTTPKGSSFTIKVPAGWYAITTAISRKPYDQGLAVAYDIVIDDSRVFGSKPGVVNDQMKITLDDSNSLPLVAQDEPYTLGLTFYYSVNAVKNAEKLVAASYQSNKINVLRTAKLPGSFDGPDTLTYFVFVEDTASQEAGTGQYDDAVAMVHLVQKSE